MSNIIGVPYNADLALFRQMLNQLPDGFHVTNNDSQIFPLMSMMQPGDTVYALVPAQLNTQIDGIPVNTMAALQDRLIFAGGGAGVTIPYSEINNAHADCGVMSCDINISKTNGGMAKVSTVLKVAANHFVNWFNPYKHQLATNQDANISTPPATPPVTPPVSNQVQGISGVPYNADFAFFREMLKQLPDGFHVTNNDSQIFPLMSMMQPGDTVYALVPAQLNTQIDGIPVNTMAALQDRLIFAGGGAGVTIPYSEINNAHADCGVMSCDINISKTNGGMAKVSTVLKVAANHFVNWFNPYKHQLATTEAPTTTTQDNKDLDSLRKEIEELEKGLNP